MPPKKLIDQAREQLRPKHYCYRTEQTYVHWIRRFILFHNKRHPAEMGDEEIRAFLVHLATKEHVAASTQNQALIPASGYSSNPRTGEHLRHHLHPSNAQKAVRQAARRAAIGKPVGQHSFATHLL